MNAVERRAYRWAAGLACVVLVPMALLVTAQISLTLAFWCYESCDSGPEWRGGSFVLWLAIVACVIGIPSALYGLIASSVRVWTVGAILLVVPSLGLVVLWAINP